MIDSRLWARDSGLGTRDSGLGTWDWGLGTRGSGLGALGSGLGIRDSGFGTRNSELGARDSGPPDTSARRLVGSGALRCLLGRLDLSLSGRRRRRSRWCLNGRRGRPDWSGASTRQELKAHPGAQQGDCRRTGPRHPRGPRPSRRTRRRGETEARRHLARARCTRRLGDRGGPAIAGSSARATQGVENHAHRAVILTRPAFRTAVRSWTAAAGQPVSDRALRPRWQPGLRRSEQSVPSSHPAAPGRTTY